MSSVQRSHIKHNLTANLEGKKISKNTDLLVYLNVVMFLKKLAKATEEELAKECETKRMGYQSTFMVKKRHAIAAAERVSRKFQG